MAVKEITDYTQRLDRLYILHKEQPIDPDFLYEELKRVCVAVFGYSPDDVEEDLIPPQHLKWFNKVINQDDDGYEAQRWARRKGYDIRGLQWDNWPTVLWMILAKSLGILTPENKAAVKLKREAEQLIANKRKGVISGAR
jgi:hypothetical protein